ncbi:hypothetical protein RTO_00980 [[Ruminococcus] torques L2-14]|uniref:Uncharacterized protein n=1 Tax=[Ruminococcus] torques L2-14 TaxID=657313 RepID=D4M0Y7_9FIRM|nr:hypothetical protein RTO_00980 [[Ruminococcus] torques L2-14]
MYVELLVGNESGTKVYQPVVQEGIEWSTERKTPPANWFSKSCMTTFLIFQKVVQSG